MKIRVYGPMRGQTSWPRVAKGVAGALDKLGVLAGVYDVQSVLDDDDSFQPGFDAEVGLFIGPPNEIGVISSRGRHTHRLAMVAANSSWLPDTTMRFLRKHVTGLVAPSEWACDVLKKYSEGLPVYLYKHGVSKEFTCPEKVTYYDSGRFKVAHFASTTMQRKGTRELIRAWAHNHELAENMWPSGMSELKLYLDGSDSSFKFEIENLAKIYSHFDPSSIIFMGPVKGDEETMRNIYRVFDLVCQPSRSEGFGLVPLEALCSGVPVVATLCTGHREYLSYNTPGAITVRTGVDELIDDGPGAVAPALNFYDVAFALTHARRQKITQIEQAVANAPKLREEWSWEFVTQEFLASASFL